LRLTVKAGRVAALPGGIVAAPPDTPLPTVMRKALEAGLAVLDSGRRNKKLPRT
jgi:A/G-specific adenine glycosylase